MDPLAVLRDYAARGDLDKIIFSGDEVLFGSEYTFPANAPTAFTNKQSGRPYPLSAAVFLAQHNDLKHTDFIQAARLRRIPPVSLPDRKTFLDFLRHGHHSLPTDPLLPSALPSFAPEPQPTLPEEPEGDKASGAYIRSLERTLKDRNALLDARGRDFLAVLQNATRREEERRRNKDSVTTSARHAPSAAAVAMAKPKVERSFGEGFVPIILVPSASQTLVTIYNVREFLEDGVFVPSEERMRAMKGSGKPDCVMVQKKLIRGERTGAGGGATTFEVRDKPASLKPDDWARVVAVFVLGKEWQFKDWPFKDHVEIFNKVIGFYVRFEDDSVEAAKVVKQWNVKIISISKNKRHQDRTAALEVWERLEEFMRAHT
ncbi:protein CDC73 homolog [Oryza brachyantha]|uniref:PHP n=1 Tax=Oryza brachyantha TaxID=4533 RepID=J3LRD5_ORYBR|nr:protein CDC73 homolog [Oryza brachyantha]XP_006650384.1 protein CDC73 homolog [Oryza brachyantha]